MNIRIAGFGGQGVVLAGYTLGHAAVLDGNNALQTQSYGSESRGGACKSDVIISAGEILDLAPRRLHALLALAQPALDKYRPDLDDQSTLIYDSGLVRAGDGRGRAVGLPATKMAHETFGRDVLANVIMLGCFCGLTGVVSRAALRKAIAQDVPPRTVETNLAACDAGFAQAAQAARHHPEPVT